MRNKSSDINKVPMDHKSSQIKYNSSTNQYVSSMYSLQKLGFNKINKNNQNRMTQELGHKCYKLEKTNDYGNNFQLIIQINLVIH